VHFDSRLPHRVIARSKKAPEILLVASPLSLERRTAATTFSLNHASRAIPLLEIGAKTRGLSSPS